MVQSLGLDLRASLLIKGAILAMVTWTVLAWRPRLLLPGALLTLAVLATPVRGITAGTASALSYDLPIAIRLLLLFFMSGFVIRSAVREPSRYLSNASLALRLGFWVVCANVLSGHLGLGHATYPSTGVGYKGFFFAGNELSALFLVLAAFVLYRSKTDGQWLRYLLLSVLVLVVGVSVGTKAAIASAVGLTLLVPVLRPWRLVPSGRAVAISCLVAVSLVFAAFNLREAIRESQSYQRISYVYDTLGWRRLVFSGRDELAAVYVRAVSQEVEPTNLLLGFGTGRIDLGPDVVVVESDPVDLAMLFGWPVAMAVVSGALTGILIGLVRLGRSPYAPLIVLVNSMLLIFAVIAGHVWTSGMLVIPWSLLTGLLWIDGTSHRQAFPFKQRRSLEAIHPSSGG